MCERLPLNAAHSRRIYICHYFNNPQYQLLLLIIDINAKPIYIAMLFPN